MVIHNQTYTRLPITNWILTFFLTGVTLNASCPDTTPWNTPVQLSTTDDVTSNIFSAATGNGFMAVWVDGSSNGYYSFSADGVSWNRGLIAPAEGNVGTNSDIFVAGNSTGFIATWIDGDNNAWSSFTTDNGVTWSNALQINTTLTLNSNSDVYVGGSETGFVATMIGADNNAYVTFSTGTQTWDVPTQVTSNGTVYDQNWNSQTTRGFVHATVVGNTCMLTWIADNLATWSAYFDTINPFSSTIPYPIAYVGFFESVPVAAERKGYFLAASRANVGDSVTLFSTATTPSNWASFSLFLETDFINNQAGPWVASNHAGFMSTWVVSTDENDPGNPIWTLSENNGFNWTPLCPILATESTTIVGPIALSANAEGFLATWLDTRDGNAYASFYRTPAPSNTGNSIFVQLLQQKYGPLL